MKRKETFIEKFDYKAFQTFVKEAFKKSDSISVYLNKPVLDVKELSIGRNSFIGKNLIHVENCNDNKMSPFVPYAHVKLRKSFEVLEALKRIEKWTDFYGEDEDSDYYMLALSFCKDDLEIAYISSHYVDYHSEFGWN